MSQIKTNSITNIGNQGDDNITLNSDGSTEFSGSINTGGNVVADESVRVTRSNGKSVTLGGSDTVALWNSDGTFEINQDGSASFADTVTSGPLDLSATDTAGCVMRPDGLLRLQREANKGGSAVMQVYNGTTVSTTLNANGSSQFMGQLQISTIPNVGGLSEKVLLHEQGWIRVYNATTDASANMYLAYSDVNGAGTVGFFVTANGVVSARNTAISQIGSERRLKNTIEPLDPVTSWETIRDLPYYSYKLNGNDDTTYYGPIVDECPEEMIVEGATSDEEGNIRTYDNSLLQSRLFVALQTALTRIEALEVEVQALKSAT